MNNYENKCINIEDYIDFDNIIVKKINSLNKALIQNIVDDQKWIDQTKARIKNLENYHDVIETINICDEAD